jgi:hypothetical protein
MRNQSKSHIRQHIAGTCVVGLFVLAAAGCNATKSPLAPSPGPEPVAPPPVTSPAFVISGRVSADDVAVPNARVAIAEGSNTGSSAMTNDEGRYQLGDLPAGAYVLRVTVDGFEPATSSVSLNGDRTVDFKMSRVSSTPTPAPSDPPANEHWSLTGTVKNKPAGESVTGARVEVIDGANRGRATMSASGGEFELPELTPGVLTLRATADGFDAETVTVTLDSNRTIEFALNPSAPPEPSGPAVSGRAVDVLSGQPLPGVHVRVDGGTEATTSGDGSFTVTGTDGTMQRVMLSSSVTIERHTQLRVPGDEATLTLIPRALDLRSFDEMLRTRGGLHRWVTPPRLVIERRVLAFTNTTDMTYVATAETMSEADAAAIAADLSWALPLLTGETFGAFASVEVRESAEGASIAISQPGTILVARFDGLESAISAWGYGRWAWNPAGEVQMGAIMLDNAFETSDSPYLRSLRAHELGHALGYDHVSAGHSVMNASGRIEPTHFDIEATTIAFRRSPLNQSPDVDPDPVTVNRLKTTRSVVWEGAK